MGTCLRRLIGHLDAILEHGDREVRGRVAGEPEAESGVGGLRRQRLTAALQRGHPTHCQMAVLEDYPSSAGSCTLDQLFSLQVSRNEALVSGRS